MDDWTRSTWERFLKPGSPWQNAYGESFGRRLRSELLNAELFTSVAEARWVIEA